MDLDRTLTEIEGTDWGPAPYQSYLVATCHRLRHKPIGEFTTEDLRIMIGQQIGLPHLVPIALETLEKDPFAQGDFYPGDLLACVLRASVAFYVSRSDLRRRTLEVLRTARARLSGMVPVDRKIVEKTLEEATRQFAQSGATD